MKGNHGEGQSNVIRWPNGQPGNRRTGPSKGQAGAKNRGQRPAAEDPLILERRAMVAKHSAEGLTASQIRHHVNAWLTTQGQDEISLKTIYNDRQAIKQDWQEAFDETVEDSRVGLLAHLLRMRDEAEEDLRATRLMKGNTAPLHSVIARYNAQIADLTGATKQAERKGQEAPQDTLQRVYVGVDMDAI